MSARDDYPLHRALEMLNGGPSALDELDDLRRLNDYIIACRVEAPDVLHYVSATHYDYRTDKAYNLLATLKGMTRPRISRD